MLLCILDINSTFTGSVKTEVSEIIHNVGGHVIIKKCPCEKFEKILEICFKAVLAS